MSWNEWRAKHRTIPMLLKLHFIVVFFLFHLIFLFSYRWGSIIVIPTVATSYYFSYLLWLMMYYRRSRLVYRWIICLRMNRHKWMNSEIKKDWPYDSTSSRWYWFEFFHFLPSSLLLYSFIYKFIGTEYIETVSVTTLFIVEITLFTIETGMQKRCRRKEKKKHFFKN